ncbi:SWIB/MDM2 domain-containing protein [Lichenicoccus sp.]|uniref:SWIB/MDM2 domain-containing protein n=1 Tax=Lichenicoccus sp. TaxID=2781899 RepID=UPI003D0B6982
MTEVTKKTAPKSAPAKSPAAKPAVAKASPGKSAVKSGGVDKPKPGSKPNALQQPLQPSEALAAVVGEGKLARGEVVKRVWDYIKSHKLQNPSDGREILADDKLKKVFGKDKVTMFEMNKLLAQNVK